ncbi:MAG TPA: methyltransferase [Bacteroidales bacterium]|nr:methyltransferase [Bacteroidales bacterium]
MFRFKYFSLEDKGATMKTGTDAVMLGAWAGIDGAGRVLDIGTGSGIIALMMAQQSEAVIDAVEIDKTSAELAAANAAKSQWAGRINVIHASFQQFAAVTMNKYDIVISNPPYFRRSLKAPDASRCRARHDEELPVNELLAGIEKALAPGGKAHLVFPADDLQLWLDEALFVKLHCCRLTRVVSKSGKMPYRVLATFTHEVSELSENMLTIHHEDGTFTDEYRQLTADFYLAF